MRELKLGEQLMPTPLVTAQVHLKVARACLCHCSEQHISLQVHFDWESRIQREQIKISEIFSKVRLFRSMHDVIDGESHILTVMLLPLSCRVDAASPHRRRKSCTSRRYGSFKCMARHSFTCTTRRFSPAATSSSPPTHRECRCGRLRPKMHVHAPDSCFVGQFLHPITKEELHSPFFFSDLQRWEYT